MIQNKLTNMILDYLKHHNRLPKYLIISSDDIAFLREDLNIPIEQDIKTFQGITLIVDEQVR